MKINMYIVPEDFKILTHIEESFQFNTGRRNGKQKGGNEIH